MAKIRFPRAAFLSHFHNRGGIPGRLFDGHANGESTCSAGNTQVAVLLTSTANDQLAAFYLSILIYECDL
jgi:hypothetical protein